MPLGILLSFSKTIHLPVLQNSSQHRLNLHHSPMDLRRSISSQTTLALTMNHHLTATTIAASTNLVFSPISLHVVLGLVAAGASDKTLTELLSFLDSDSKDHLRNLTGEMVGVVLGDGEGVGGPKVAKAIGVWVDRSVTLKAEFREGVVRGFGAAAREVDFQNKAVEATSEVNSWAEKETNGLIKEVLPVGSVDHTTRLILANAVYFKGAWDEKFDASKTKDYDFHILDGSTVKVPFMTSRKKQLVAAYDHFKVLNLPYKQGEDKRFFSMYILLPDASDGLAALAEKVSSVPDFLDKHAPHEKVDLGHFRIPRFKISFGFEASSLLKGLGLGSIFDAGGLTEMVESAEVGRNLGVSSIFQKSFVEVNEEGTEAAAATAAVINLRSIRMEKKIDFVADHPFLFVIREDKTGVVLFVGHVLNPLLTE
ncbi:Serpin-ZX-like protein [Drosera capensis]